MRISESFFHSLVVLFAVCGISSGQETAEHLAEQTAKESAKGHASDNTAVEQKPALVKVEDIHEFVGSQVKVQYVVRSSTLINAKKICFLNSQKDYRDKKNFAVVIKSDTLEAFADQGVANPAKHFYRKNIEVRGTVTRHQGKPQLLVTKFEQVKILNSKHAEPTGADNESRVAGVTANLKKAN